MQSSESARAAGGAGGSLAICYPSASPGPGGMTSPYPPLRPAGDGSPLPSDEVTCLGPGAQDDPTPLTPCPRK